MSAQSQSFFRHIFSFKIITVLLVIFLGFFGIYRFIAFRSAVHKIKYALTPPELPKYRELETIHLNPEGWGKYNDHWFHNTSQGTATLPIPYDWLIALEEPSSNPWFIFFSEKKPFVEDYILRLGFIKGAKSIENPDGLPIGLARTESLYFPGIGRKAAAVGFTCAACHTGQMIHDDKRYVIDGGPAMTDISLLRTSLGAALGQTVLSSKFLVFNHRFKRFAERVLGSHDNVLTRSRLKKELANTISELAKSQDTILVTEGFTRLDALNRIGNQVFAKAMNRESNYSPIVAPVNFPHIWTTSWFNWVQYDASIMQPLVRNVGEALGVKAYVNTTAGESFENNNDKNQRFASSVPVKKLVEMEEWLGGTHPLKNGNEFNGITAPAWPAEFPEIDQDLANAGAVLYKNRCQHCHLPPVTSDEFWDSKYWHKIQYMEDGEIKTTDDPYLKLIVKPLDFIGTDQAQASVLINRTVDTTGLHLDTHVYTWPPKPLNSDSDSPAPMLTKVPVKDSATSLFALALGAFVERTNQQWFDQNYVPEDQQPIYEGLRPNGLQAGQGYKARPLNGVWATAPFLHNGSVPTLYDLLSPLKDRPTFVELGDQTFDTEKVGIFQGETIKKLNKQSQEQDHRVMDDYSDGRFILDTRTRGNHNTGHLFDDDKDVRGRIYKAFTKAEKMQLIEYLKTL